MVTGAAGFIGSHLSERLAPDNDLLLIDDFSVGPRENLAALADRERTRIVLLRNCIAAQSVCRT